MLKLVDVQTLNPPQKVFINLDHLSSVVVEQSEALIKLNNGDVFRVDVKDWAIIKVKLATGKP